MKRLRVGVIGLGVGEEHIAAYQAHPACELVAVCDLSPERRPARNIRPLPSWTTQRKS